MICGFFHLSMLVCFKNLNPSNLIFEDQINSITGYINQESIDPLADFFLAKNYSDLGLPLLFIILTF